MQRNCKCINVAVKQKLKNTMKHLLKLKWMLALVAVALITACGDDDDPEPVNEEELITTLNVTFTNTGDATDVVVASFQDLDGPGGDAPVVQNPTLTANANYSVAVEFLNEQESPAENITEEVEEEDDEHQVFFVPGNGLGFIYTYGDADADGNPLGLTGTAAIGDAGTGSLNVLLIHEPNKTASGVRNGDPSNAGGETDMSVTFNVTVQ